MSSCLRKLDKKSAVICPNGQMYVQGHEPKYCALGTPGRRMFCGEFFYCSKCYRAYKTCQELLRHKRHYH